MISVIDEEEELLIQLHSDVSKKGQHFLSLRAYEIVDFSSQYGSEDSVSYTAENFLGPPSIFPRVGDHAFSFQLRTYGKWWQDVPSYPKTPVNLPFGSSVESQDFIEFRVERRVVPVLMRIYEIYNPGTIVKIFAFCYDNERWVLLWQGDPDDFVNPKQARCFSVSFEGVHFLSDYYRVEFHHRHLKYFCELDGVILYGEDKFPLYFPSYNIPNSNFPKITLKQLINNHVESEAVNNLMESDACTDNNFTEDSHCYFDLLPQEVILSIMSYLDLQSLCNSSIVCRSFNKACYDPMLYKVLNLQIYWHLVDTSALKGLHSRLDCLKHLNLSWCGGQGRITPPYFIEFVEVRCGYLSVLKISSCPFVNNNCMKAMANYCQNLEVLEMRCCRAKDLTQSGFRCISQMSKLKYLDLYRTLVDTTSVIAIVRNCTNLEHLLLGSCTNIGTFDEVARAISRHLRNIKSLDCWRGISLTCLGIYELAENCHSLVELDLGWCYKVDANCGCLRQLLIHNQNLRKLVLTAIRTVSNNELNAIVTCCKDIEQLDILGNSEVDLVTVERVLDSCSSLKLLDVSYCDNSVKEAVPALQEKFTSVEIKCSIPPNMN